MPKLKRSKAARPPSNSSRRRKGIDPKADLPVSSEPPKPSESYTTGNGREISYYVAKQLAQFRLQLLPPVMGSRVWNQLLSADDRLRLGGNFQTAYTPEGTVGMYMRARHVSYERALLEISNSLGLMPDAIFRQLLEAVEGPASGGLKPQWDKERLQLMLGGKLLKRVRGRSVARNICMILDVFEESEWPPHIDDPLPGPRPENRLRGAIRSLNENLECIRFFADGTGQGICWRFA